MNKHLITASIAFFALCNKAFSQVNNQQTIESLVQQIAVLEAKVSDLTSRLPYRQMAVMTLEGSDANMTSAISAEGYKYYNRDIKIDNPISNNNPKAIIMVTRQQPGANVSNLISDIRPVNVFYNSNDKYWYLRLPDKKISGLFPGLVIDGILKEAAYTILHGRILETKGQVSGVAYAAGIYPLPGEKYSVIIFDELDTPMRPKPAPSDVAPPVTTDQTPPTKVANPYNISISGEWNYKLTSVSGTVFSGKVFLVINESTVTGNLFPQDKTKSEIKGTFINNTLSLSRETGLETTQFYELTRSSARQFTGSYVNKGKYPDSGVIEFYR